MWNDIKFETQESYTHTKLSCVEASIDHMAFGNHFFQQSYTALIDYPKDLTIGTASSI